MSGIKEAMDRGWVNHLSNKRQSGLLSWDSYEEGWMDCLRYMAVQFQAQLEKEETDVETNTIIIEDKPVMR